MSTAHPQLSVTERFRATETLYETMRHREGRMKWTALAIALAIHAVVLMLHFPELRPEPPEQAPSHPVIVVRKYVPPPPPIERRAPVRQRLTRKVPLPDPTPDEPEPIREPLPELPPIDPIPPDAEVILGIPEGGPPPLPAVGPLIPGVGGVTTPRLIPETYVKPEYPELARKARLEANVILQAVIHRDGSVGEIEVMRCTQMALGFEDAAIAAVSQWRYEPATQNGRPVEVFLTVFVEFDLV